jgi:tRNA dimethylallyltransferase
VIDLITILGPTASGKTALAAALAARIDAEIISADSRQVYREMTIGTGKDLDDYVVNGRLIPYHLIDICPPGYKYNIFEYQRDFQQAYAQIKARHRWPILCGGSGLYLESVLKAYQLPEAPEDPSLRAALDDKSPEELEKILASHKTPHNTTDLTDTKRTVRAIEIETAGRSQPADASGPIPPNSLTIGIQLDRQSRRQSISDRLKKRLREGLPDEVRMLLNKGISPSDLIYYGLEYKYVTLYLLGVLSFDEMFAQLETAIHRFSKRQMTWFRGMERRGLHIHWLNASLPIEEKVGEICRMMAGERR